MNDFLAFRRMITPRLIEILFLIGSVAIIVGGLILLLGGIIGAFGSGEGGGARLLAILGALIGSPLVTLLSLLLFRVWCETIILFFRMNETLSDLRERGRTG